MYSIHLQQIQRSNGLKDCILANVSDLQFPKQGLDVLLVFSNDIGTALKQTHTSIVRLR